MMTLWQVSRWFLALAWVIFGTFGWVFFLMSPMIFDAPNSTKDWRNWVVLCVFLTLAPLCDLSLAGFGLSLAYKNERAASVFAALPLIPLVVFALMLMTGK